MHSALARARRYKIGLFSVFTGCLAFLTTQSLEILNPARFGFMWGSGDISSSFVSWTYFRQTSLTQWPLTINPNMGQPWARGILFTDTPPIFAIPLKFLFQDVSSAFQFTGLQILLSTCLLVYFTSKSLVALRVGFWTAQVGALMVATAPFLIFRDEFRHYSFNILWIVSASIYLVVRSSRRFPSLAWASLVFVALTWMPYFVVPVVMLWIPSLILSRTLYRRTPTRWAFDCLLPLIAGFIALVIDGFWYNASSSGDFGIGYYNANLLALINPMATASSSWSQLLPDLGAATDGQYEGFAFIGTGGIVLMLAAAFAFLLRPQVARGAFRSPKIRSLMISVVIAWFSATALSFDFGDYHLFTIELPSSLNSAASIFRSSGRFMLLVAIVLLVGAITIISRSMKKSLVLALVSFALVFTYLDSREQIQVNIAQQANNPQFPPGFLQAARFLDLHSAPETKVVFIPPEDSAYKWKMDILGAAAFRNLPANDAFVARPNLEKLDQERARTSEMFMGGEIPATDVWVIYPEYAQSHMATLGSLLKVHCWTNISGAYVISGRICPNE